MNDAPANAATTLFPPIEPYRTDLIAVDGGHRLHVEQCGNPAGAPVLFLHGGPGSCIKPDHRRYFDPSHHRIVLFDQRGCGRSTPSGATAFNTTAHLVQDIERIRGLLGVDRWMLFGGSWGSTLALAYAQAHPARVSALVLRGIFTAPRSELEWYFAGLRQFIPDAWDALHVVAPRASWPQLVSVYRELLQGADRPQALAAAARWNAYESAIMSIGEGSSMSPAATSDDGALARARVQVHYLKHGCFLRDRQLLDEVHRIAHLPCILLHGAMDFVCPPVTAVELSRRWPGSRLVMIPSAKHASSHPAFERELVAAAGSLRELARA